jgi:hypothetical protein
MGATKEGHGTSSRESHATGIVAPKKRLNVEEVTMHDQMMGVWGRVGYAAMVLFFSVGAMP